MILKKNLFDLSKINDFTEEVIDSLLESENFKVERIISRGQSTPKGQWFDQEQAEWVVVLQGEALLIAIENNTEQSMMLKPGDYVLLPPHQKHRVADTSTDPPCIWLAIHDFSS